MAYLNFMKLTALFKKNFENQTDAVDVATWEATEEAIRDTAGGESANASDARHEAVELLSEVIPEEISSLDAFILDAESDFMLLGIGLRTVHANVTELTELMLGTVKRMGTDAKGGFLDKGRKILNESMTEIQSRQNEVKANLDRINALMDDIENLHSTSKQIKKFAKSLKTVALTMLVENARTIDMSVNIFSDVAREIKDLSVNISNIANDVYKNVEKAQGVHSVTREEISTGIERLESLTNRIRTTVQESTHDTEELMRFSVDIIEESGRRSREISLQVAEIVVGVQFHDNMKQRIMSINEILNAILSSTALNGKADAPEGGNPKNPAAAVIRAQAGMLDEINHELEGVYETNRAALKKIHREVDDLLKGLRPMASDEKGSNSGTFSHDPFYHLKGALTQLHDLLHRGETLYQQIRKAADQVSDIAADLSELLGIVRNISADTHNKAINSIIAANRQGEKGGALKLLAQAMNDLATQSDGFSSEVEDIITSIIKAAEDIIRKETRETVAPPDNSSAINRLGTIINDISLEYENFRESSLAAYHRAQELKKATDTTLTSLDFFRGLSQKINDHRNRLLDTAGQPGQDTLLLDVNLVAGGHVPGRHITDQVDNIILFEEAKRTIRESSHGAGEDVTFSDNVELF